MTVEKAVLPCDVCGAPATIIVEMTLVGKAGTYCDEHMYQAGMTFDRDANVMTLHMARPELVFDEPTIFGPRE